MTPLAQRTIVSLSVHPIQLRGLAKGLGVSIQDLRIAVAELTRMFPVGVYLVSTPEAGPCVKMRAKFCADVIRFAESIWPYVEAIENEPDATHVTVAS